jgi:general secretion pathway protein J
MGGLAQWWRARSTFGHPANWTGGPLTTVRSRGRLVGMAMDAGFTLLELLVALVICGFVLTSLAEGTRFGLLSWSIETRLTRGNDDLEIADGIVRHLIEGMDAGGGIDPAQMSGGEDRFECVSTLPNADGPVPVRRIAGELRVTDDHRLVLKWRPYSRALYSGSRPATTETELVRGLARIKVFYWGQGGNWINAWHSDSLPVLVRVRLQFPDGDSRHWPDIVAAPDLDRR